ncbi:AraC family transcriptional regulator [Microbacterium sp. X-17]|uniref:helix-turn-helix transcriptional regulator n=1 Tax=Microbacterium sp. X-17 TaxID=3144404 RepID=UPI0031F5785B
MGTFRTAVSTTDSEYAMAVLNDMYSGVEMEPHPEKFGLDLSAVGDERFAILHEQWTSSGRFQMEPQPIVIVVEVTEGAWDCSIGRTPVDTTRPSLFPAAAADASWQDSFTVNGTQLDARQINTFAADHFATPGLRVAFTGSAPVSMSLQRSWEATTAFVRDNVVTEEALLSNDLIRDRAFEILISCLLVTFPNNTLDLPAGHDGARALPAAVRRAIGYMEEHLSEPIRLEDLAGAARLSPRGLQDVFLRILGTSPTRYLRGLRMEAARADLRAAKPGDTVATIAHRWGFVHVPRFAAAYRDAFGENPSETLRG